MKPWFIVKSILYITLGAAILLFYNEIMEFVGIMVGAVVAFYGVDIAVLSIIEKQYFGENHLFFGGLVQILMGVCLFVVRADIISVCLVWAVWSILREGKELSEALHSVIEKRIGFINIVESIIIIVFSFLMIMEPGEHHARIHVIILGIELLLEVLFPILNGAMENFMEKKKASRLEAAESTEVSATKVDEN